MLTCICKQHHVCEKETYMYREEDIVYVYIKEDI